MACVEIPPDPPDFWVRDVGPNEVDVIIHDYTTYGANAGADYCACALNLPATFGQVISATIIDRNTGQPMPGFTFGPNPNTTAGFNAVVPADWNGFSSDVSQLITAGIPIDIVFRVHDPERLVSGAAIADHLSNAGVELIATDGADPDGSPNGHHQSFQPAGEVGQALTIFGLENESFGQARLERSGGQLVVSNIGSSGQDGVRFVAPPGSQGGAFTLDDFCPTGPPPPGRGTGLRGSNFNVDSFFDITYRVSPSDTWQVEAQQSGAAPACMQVQVYDDGKLQADVCVPQGTPLLEFPTTACPLELALFEDTGECRYRSVLDQSVDIQIGGEPDPVRGNEVHIFDSTAAPIDIELISLSLQSVQPIQVTVGLEEIQQFGQFHSALGQGTYANDASGHLIISNLGSSGQDGVRSVGSGDFRIDSFFDVWTELVVDPDPTGGGPDGAFVRFSAEGPVHGATVQPLGDLTVTRQVGPPPVHILTPDFSPVGSSTVRLEIYEGGNLVQSFSGLSPAGVASYSEWPAATGKLSSGWPPILSCFVQNWANPVEITVGGGAAARGGAVTVVGDELRILAEGGAPVDGVSSMSVTAASYDQVEIAGQGTTEASDSDGDGVPDSVDNCVFDELQCDTNGDGFGNACDADLDNNGIVNTFDLGRLRAALGQSGPNDADLDCNGIVNTFDLTRMRNGFGQPPGPSGQAP